MNTKTPEPTDLPAIQLRALATHMDNLALRCRDLFKKIPAVYAIANTVDLNVTRYNDVHKAFEVLYKADNSAQVISKALRDMADAKASKNV